MKTLFIIFLASLSFTTFASEPVGSHTNGTLIDAECIPESGEGFMSLYRDVDRIWGTTEMIDMLERTASDMSRRYPGRDRLQIEEMSAKNGGDIDGHGSHENGLDADIGYFKANGIEHDGNGWAPSMVENGGVSSNFDIERNWELMKSLHRNGRVSRIFVDQTLKNRLCQYAKDKGEFSSNLRVLGSIRHVENHADHLHVRLRCPVSARRCTDQGPPPASSGCP